MNIRKKDIAVLRDHSGAWVLSTLLDGYLKTARYYDISLKWARVDFIENLKKEVKSGKVYF